MHRVVPINDLKLFLFDLDGTLVDSRQDLANSINAMLKHFHRAELDTSIIATYIGDGAPCLVRRALGYPDQADLKHKDEEFVEEALIYFLDWYREHKLDFTYVYDGIFDVLDAIQASAENSTLKMAVLSNKPVGPSRAICYALNLSKYFFAVHGGNSFETKKPDPLGVNMLLAECGVKAEQAVIIGDSAIDMQTAVNSGIWSVGVKYGLSPETLTQTNGDIHVDTPQELSKVLLG